MNHLQSLSEKIIDRDRLGELRNRWEAEKTTVVFTNGCFDILHTGHVQYLSQAADLGDELVLGLNSDHSVRLLNKGKNRPLQPEAARATVMAALGFVDWVIRFDEETPYELIQQVQPDVLVKGADYEIHEIAGHDIVLEKGGRVETIPLVEGYSTSLIEQKIRDGH